MLGKILAVVIIGIWCARMRLLNWKASKRRGKLHERTKGLTNQDEIEVLQMPRDPEVGTCEEVRHGRL